MTTARGRVAACLIVFLGLVVTGLPLAPPSLRPAPAAADPITCSYPSGTPWGTDPVARVSRSTAGAQADDHSEPSVVSADGRYLFFNSAATTLVDGQTTSGSRLFRHDRQSGQTVRLLVEAGKFAVSADGNQVAFDTTTFDLLGGEASTAVRFDGSNDQVSIPHAAAFNLTGDLTLEAWVLPATLDGDDGDTLRGDGDRASRVHRGWREETLDDFARTHGRASGRSSRTGLHDSSSARRGPHHRHAYRADGGRSRSPIVAGSVVVPTNSAAHAERRKHEAAGPGTITVARAGRELR